MSRNVLKPYNVKQRSGYRKKKMSGACILKPEKSSDDNSVIESGADVDCKEYEGRTLSQRIAAIPNCIPHAIKRKYEVNARNRVGNTPLHTAAMYSEKSFNLIHDLIQYGSDVNARNNEGNTPLHLAAASFCCWNVVKKLVDAGAKVNARNHAGNTPLHFAIQHRRSNTASALLISGADVNIRNETGSMPLHLALILLPHGRIVTEILNAGASVNDRNGNGYSPLHLAVAKIFPAASNLIKLGAMVRALDFSGNKSRIYIGHSSHLSSILDGVESEVLEKVAMSNLSLHFAAKSADCDIQVIQILSSEIEVDLQDIDGMTPLHHATKNPRCNENIIEVLVKNGGCVNTVDLEGNCPLHYAVQSATINLAIISTLLKYGAKVGLRNRFGDNVLHCALKNSSIEREELLTCLKMLVKFAIFQNEFLSNKFCLELSNKLPELSSYKSECLEERKKMKEFVVHNSISMLDFAISRDDHLKSQAEKVFQALLTNSFPIYNDVLLINIEKKYLQEKILTQEVYATYELPFKTNRVVLKHDCVCNLSEFLSKQDLLNLCIAYKHHNHVVHS